MAAPSVFVFYMQKKTFPVLIAVIGWLLSVLLAAMDRLKVFRLYLSMAIVTEVLNDRHARHLPDRYRRNVSTNR